MAFFLPLLAVAAGMGAQYKSERDAEKKRRGVIRKYDARSSARAREADAKDFAALSGNARALAPARRYAQQDAQAAQTMDRLRTLFADTDARTYAPIEGNVSPEYAQYAARRAAETNTAADAGAQRAARLMAVGQGGQIDAARTNEAALNQAIIRSRFNRAQGADTERVQRRVSNIQPDPGLRFAGQLLQMAGMHFLTAGLGAGAGGGGGAAQPPTGISPFR